MTPAAKEFVTPLTLATLTRKPVISEFFDRRDGTWHSHVDLGLWADAMVIAPATASTIGKMANGVADNMLVTTYLSMKAPVFVAPAMDLDMYAHPTTQRNLETLRSFGNTIVEPGTGFLASQLEGKGRMQEPERIIEVLDRALNDDKCLAGKKVLVTAGPTYENIDPVRFIGNYSSGKMGFALAEECSRRGAEVFLVTGPVTQQTHYPGIQRIDVETARQMSEEATRLFPQCDVSILCAAVADFRPADVATSKIKRKGRNLTIELEPTCDIAALLGSMKREGQVMVGFALETDNESENAHAKLKKKKLDFIVMNSLRDEGAGFRHDTNKITIIDNGGTTDYQLKGKREVATDIVDYLTRFV